MIGNFELELEGAVVDLSSKDTVPQRCLLVDSSQSDCDSNVHYISPSLSNKHIKPLINLKIKCKSKVAGRPSLPPIFSLITGNTYSVRPSDVVHQSGGRPLTWEVNSNSNSGNEGAVAVLPVVSVDNALVLSQWEGFRYAG